MVLCCMIPSIKKISFLEIIAMTEPVDKERRRFLTAATVAAGAVGVAGASVPFIESWKPSAKAQAAGAPVEVDISDLKPGQMKIVEWRGKPVWVVRRTPEAIESLVEVEQKLRDPESNESLQPEYTKNRHRSIQEEYLVMVGVCTHLGCSPKYKPELGSVSLEWKGGFFCPCHGSAFDMAGRVFQGVPAPVNMQIPPHYFVDAKTVMIGLEQGGDA